MTPRERAEQFFELLDEYSALKATARASGPSFHAAFVCGREECIERLAELLDDHD